MLQMACINVSLLTVMSSTRAELVMIHAVSAKSAEVKKQKDGKSREQTLENMVFQLSRQIFKDKNKIRLRPGMHMGILPSVT